MTLRAGYSEFYPYVTSDRDGKPTGMAVQVVQEAAARAGIRLQWISVDDAEKALRAGQIDLFPLFTVTAERERNLHLSAAVVGVVAEPGVAPRSAVARSRRYGRQEHRDSRSDLRHSLTTRPLPGAKLVPTRARGK